MEVIADTRNNHKPAFIVVQSNEWNNHEVALKEISQHCTAMTSFPVNKKAVSMTWQKITLPHKKLTLYTYAIVINVDEPVYDSVVDILEKGQPDEATQHRRPMIYNWILQRACLAENVSLQAIEDTMKLQNNHLST